MARQGVVLSALDVAAVLGQMAAQCSAAAERSEVLGREFASGEAGDARTDAFLSAFVDERTRFHETTVKLEAAREVAAASWP